MFVTLRNLQEESFVVEVEQNDSVRVFKEKIEKVKGDAYPAKYIKLMYAGKFLLDNNKVSDYSVEEKKFVIIVVKKPIRPRVKQDDINRSGGPSRALLNGIAESALGQEVCEEHERLITAISDLGYSREEVMQALNATFNDPDQAVEFLINGLHHQARAAQEAEENERSDDQVEILADPIITTSMPGTSTSYPLDDIARLAADNEGADTSQAQTREHAVDEQENDGDVQTAGTLDHPRLVATEPTLNYGEFRSLVDMTRRDSASIERLQQLGFPADKVIEAFLACGRNELAAADLLCSQNFE